ncbi:hypothetical protein [Candidatus Williamhamiltonella defendens]|uniref:hypothetical protein n=1 Tax=Candidatus Williamhamiltonella defendens TaxID=138072 RepID=UPI0016510559|nr:hypothetical protein [Candidatus Hamiltonella defensa]
MQITKQDSSHCIPFAFESAAVLAAGDRLLLIGHPLAALLQHIYCGYMDYNIMG